MLLNTANDLYSLLLLWLQIILKIVKSLTNSLKTNSVYGKRPMKLTSASIIVSETPMVEMPYTDMAKMKQTIWTNVTQNVK